MNFSHGRDNSLRIWQIRTADEATLSAALPAEVASANGPMPWLLHTLPVNTLNFCAFSMCYTHTQRELLNDHGPNSTSPKLSSPEHAAVLIAVPARDDKKAEVYQFPNEKLRYVVPRAQSKDTGEFQSLTELAALKGFLEVSKYAQISSESPPFKQP